METSRIDVFRLDIPLEKPKRMKVLGDPVMTFEELSFE